MSEPEPGGDLLRRGDPRQIGPYVILGRLGAGSMGRVYLGRSAAGRLVAVKTIRADLADEAGFRARFEQEVTAAGRVSGFFTAAVVEADPGADLPWLATAYVAAPSLSQLVRACGPLPVPAVQWLAAGCAEALDSIHRAGLIHRDLKPSNVLVAADGPRVIDFGVARAAEAASHATSHGTVGTPAYMAPEQARDTHRASAASDVYSLGATLAFAATGQPLYHGDSATSVLIRLATEQPDLSAVPPDLVPLVAACLQREPAGRPTPAGILAGLGSFAEAHPGPGGTHPYLPGAAMTLIAQYQHNPLLAVSAGTADAADTADTEAGPDATAPSYAVSYPAPSHPAQAHSAPAHRAPSPPGTRAGTGHRREGGRRPWLRAHRAVAAWASAAAALVVGGVLLGISLTSSGGTGSGPGASPNSAPPPLAGPPPAPATVCGQVAAGSGPGLCMMNQSAGPAGTAFAVRGSRFAPGTSVTFSLTEVGPPPQYQTLVKATSPYHATVGPDGTFTVQVSKLYARSFGLGQVTVAATDGGTARTEFMIIPPAPPSGGPPAG
jgi:serine/threonine protein kinase